MVKAAGLTPDEAYKTFNMGVGMSVICDPADASRVSDLLAAEGLATFMMGRIVAGSGKVVYE
jgi:phosphoribosylformylglycinamidine cyclo-ligase